ncbi:hypothetical protein [Paracoccus sp. TOH]|uniref:hypothetical protein n=1 Tax=Paracoccus sp. TOH TaxID=1263728 RepID=UPI0025B1CE18|nr:hypothetical protein [Paracoccus sp. TOH]WJS85710.1 hypothetical protein NBE95_16280 [Paracoccus sp. TOH]
MAWLEMSPSSAFARIGRRPADLSAHRRRGAGGGKPFAIHVRRGGILDGDPWSSCSRPSKYVPDEFSRACVLASKGPVIAFSDTPAAVASVAGRLAAQAEPWPDLRLDKVLRQARRAGLSGGRCSAGLLTTSSERNCQSTGEPAICQ